MVNNYYQKHKEKVRKEACEKYQNLSEEEKRPEADIKIFLKKEKKKKRQYHCERNNNLSEEQKKKKVEYMS